MRGSHQKYWHIQVYRLVLGVEAEDVRFLPKQPSRNHHSTSGGWKRSGSRAAIRCDCRPSDPIIGITFPGQDLMSVQGFKLHNWDHSAIFLQSLNYLTFIQKKRQWVLLVVNPSQAGPSNFGNPVASLANAYIAASSFASTSGCISVVEESECKWFGKLPRQPSSSIAHLKEWCCFSNH